MNFFDNSEFTPSARMMTNSSLPSTQIIGWQIIDESLAWPRAIMSNTATSATITSFIQIHPI